MTGQKQILTELKSSWPVILTGDLSPVILSRPVFIYLLLFLQPLQGEASDQGDMLEALKTRRMQRQNEVT
jgi:hypothetical protein